MVSTVAPGAPFSILVEVPQEHQRLDELLAKPTPRGARPPSGCIDALGMANENDGAAANSVFPPASHAWLSATQ